jgi:hypothetical protein
VPAIIDSAPDCIIHINGAKPADDSADFILQAAYLKCQGIMTFGPGSTYGEDGTGAAGSYGPHVDRDRRDGGVIVAWVLYEDRRLWGHVARIRARDHSAPLAGPTDPP